MSCALIACSLLGVFFITTCSVYYKERLIDCGEKGLGENE